MFIGKKLSAQRGKKELGPGVMGVGKKHSEEKEGSKAKLIADSSSFLSGKKKVKKKKEVPDQFFLHECKNAINED